MVFKLGTLFHAKGYAINKLFEQHRFGAKHLPTHLLQQGYPPRCRHLISMAVDELKAEGIILIQPKRTGRDHSNHATLVWPRLDGARALLNGFRESEGLPRVGKDLKTFLPIKP